jgi:RHS repeat-associated protein
LEGSETRYRPYGEVRTEGSAVGDLTGYGFTGQALDANTGLMYYGARWYDPVLGRWIQADTIVPDFSNPQSTNRYAYCLSNPVNRIDLSGHDDTPWWLRWIEDAVRIVAGVRETARIAQGGKVTDDDWQLAADIFAPAEADASVLAVGGTASAGLPGRFFTLSGDLVTTAEGDWQVFVSVRDNRRLGQLLGITDMGDAEEWQTMASDDVAPLIAPPQIGFGVTGGPLWGDAFASDRRSTEEYAGPAINYGFAGGPSPWYVGGNAFHSFDTQTNQPTLDVVGFEGMLGASASLAPVGVNFNATYAIPTRLRGTLPGPMLLGCRLLGGCGAAH